MQPTAKATPVSPAQDVIPHPALLLGWAGVIPFAALSAALLLGIEPLRDIALRGLPGYAAVILAFMGGVQWGLEMARGTTAENGLNGYAVSVLPALLAAAALLLQPREALLLLAAGFISLLAYDLLRVRKGIGPGWYPRLRVALTCAVLASLAAAVYALRAT